MASWNRLGPPRSRSTAPAAWAPTAITACLSTAARSQSVNGNISITGQGALNASGYDEEGVDIYNGGIVQSTGTATITIVGTGGSGAGAGGRNYGVTIWGPTGKVTSATGEYFYHGNGLEGPAA